MFRPIIKGTEPDQILTALLRQPAVQQEYDESYGVTYQDVRRDADEALATIVRRYGEVAGHFDAVVILGSDYRDALGAPELGLNARIAANLNAPVAFCVSARGRSPEEVVHYARSSMEELKKHHATTIAVIPTRVPPGHEKEYRNAVGAAWSDVVAGVIPDHRVLAAPVLAAQVEAVEGRLVAGREDMLQHDSQTVIVGAMTLPNLLARLEPEATVIMPGDRTEMIPGLLMAQTSGAFPQLAGLILTGGYEVPHSIQQLITSVPHELPIAVTELGTYTTAERLFRLEGMMTSSDRKTELGRRLFSEFVDAGALLGAMHVDRAEIRTPVMFEYQLNEMARRDKRRIVLPESGDDRILEAASIVLRRGTADIILLGDPTEVKAHALASGYSLEGAEIIDMATPELVERFSEEYMRLRAAKGVTVEQAKEKGLEPSELDFYLDFFRYGVPPHGGFGMGLSRVIMLLLHQPSIREVTYLFRGPNRLTP